MSQPTGAAGTVIRAILLWIILFGWWLAIGHLGMRKPQIMLGR
jgi:uncharacterized membrane protein YccF (DUF307 family)